MVDLLTAIFNTPLSVIFIIAGLIFLGIAVIGSVSGRIEPGKVGRISSAVIGVLLFGAGLALYLGAFAPSSPEPESAAAAPPISVPEATIAPSPEPSPSPSAETVETPSEDPGDAPKLRWPVSWGGVGIIEGRAAMSDEEWVAMGLIESREDYMAEFQRRFSIDIST